MEDLLVPYNRVLRLPAQRPLVLAPHPDDEVYGCGGAIRAFVVADVPVRVVVLTDGSEGGDAAMRASESTHAANVLGYGSPIFLNIKDRTLQYGEKLVKILGDIIKDWRPDLVIAPSLLEVHPDHHACGMAALEAARRHRCKVAFYECGHPLHPNVLLDISPHLKVKRSAMHCFTSQQESQDYASQIDALNRYRTYTLGKDVQAAEAYALIDPCKTPCPPVVFGGEYAWQYQLGLSPARTESAKVSIIVRSMDRNTLITTLDSIARQTYRNIEVILVQAPGRFHRSYGDWCGRFPMHQVCEEEALSRSAAANVGLKHGCGEYVMFLDDDDWCDSNHVARLVEALAHIPRAPAAYVDVRMATADGELLKVTYDYDFSHELLLVVNYLPIHAVLFRRDMADSANCRFDENLSVYEEWDYWIQLSSLGSFVHVPGVSAYYRGVGERLGGDPCRSVEDQERSLSLIHGKWLRKVDVKALSRVMNEFFMNELSKTGDLRRAFEELQLELESVRAYARGTEQRRSALEEGVKAMQASTSWRITAPLRWIGSRLRRVRLMSCSWRAVEKLADSRKISPESGEQTG